ncbi:MAG: DNA primase [Clostridia bacterium]|nr:DNA primase [Clostridia bacterium]
MAGYFPDEFLQEVAAHNDIVEYIGSHVQLKRSGGGMVGLCPFHNEKTPSFHVSPQKQLYYCFGCGAGGTVIQFAMQMENLEFPDAVRHLAERAHLRLPEQSSGDSKAYYEKKEKIYAMNAQAARFFHEMLLSERGQKGMAYFEERKLDKKWITKFGLGYDPGGTALMEHLQKQGYDRNLMLEAGLITTNERGKTYDKFWERVIFPIINVRGQVIGFGGRILGDGKPKYLNSPDSTVFNKGKNLYAMNIAKNTKDCLIFAEGYMDVITLHRFGITQAVASLGTALTPDQAHLAARYAKDIYLCYDTDEAGVKATERAIEVFSKEKVRLKIITLPAGKDPDEFLKTYGADQFRNVMKKAKTPVQYRLNRLKKQYNTDVVEEKIEFLTEAAKILAALDSAIEREEYIKALAENIHISREAIYAEVNKLLSGKSKKEAWARPKVNTQVTIPSADAEPVAGTPAKAATRVKKVIYDAQGLLLSMLIQDPSLKDKLGDKLSSALFSEGLPKELAQKILASDKPLEAQELILAFPSEQAGAAASLLGRTDQPEDALKAAEDAVRLLKTEQQKEAYRDAIARGDMQKANEILKQMKQ